MRNFQHRPIKSRNVEFIAAEHPRLHGAVQAGLDEGLVQLRRVGTALVVFRLLRAQQRLERGGTRNQFLWRQVRLRNGYHG